ncbi:aldo/keto reductase [Streptomyces sp. NPDC046984]|uniref:aldo/keto reductase n=1 Tax=Streptomyces sp. NPDC046984 TaxID=3155138 RepID=UPI0033EDC80C
MTARTAASSLVLGTWGLAGRGGLPRDRSYGDVTDTAAYETMDHAWEAGIRIVDTAPAYGAGEGLRRVGRWQQTRGRRWRIAAKPGRPHAQHGPVSDLSLRGLMDEIECGTELTDEPAYVLVKDPDARSYADGSLAAALDSLEKRFPNLTIGVASHLPAALADFAASRLVGRTRVAQIELNAVNHRVAIPAAERLAACGWEVWAMQPLAYGFLAHPDLSPSPGADWRARIPARTQATMRAAARSFSRAVLTLRDAEPVVDLGSTDLAAWAIAFCLSVPAVARTVIGPKNPAQLDAAIAALHIASNSDLSHRLCARMK